MKHIFLILTLILSITLSFGQNRSGKISTGRTTLDFPINFTAADTIDASETYWILVDCKQNYMHTQNVSLTLATVSGSPSVTAFLEAKISTLDAYTPIDTASAWTSASNNPIVLSYNVANKYRYFKIKLVASGATQKTKVTGISFADTYSNLVDFTATTGRFTTSIVSPLYDVNGAAGITFGSADVTKFTFSGISENLILTPSTNTWTLSSTTAANVFSLGSLGLTGTGGATLTGAAINLNASSNYATNIGTGTTNAAVTIGGGSNVVAINSSDWDIDATGIATNMGTYNGLTIANGIGRLVTTATASADTLSAGALLSAADQFVTVTSGGAAYKLMLPVTTASTVGMIIRGWVGANGFELRVAAADANTVKINDVTTLVEAAIPAETFFKVECISATQWILTATTKLGAVITAIIPDAL